MAGEAFLQAEPRAANLSFRYVRFVRRTRLQGLPLARDAVVEAVAEERTFGRLLRAAPSGVLIVALTEAREGMPKLAAAIERELERRGPATAN